MDDRTFKYLKGRFGDYYRQVSFSLPPEYEKREWGYIPWTKNPGTQMVRHLSYLDMGEDVQDFFSRKRPQHAYFSATKYTTPGARTMEEKDWKSSDLVFDLDADPSHMDIIDPENDTYKEMLEKCKTPLKNILQILRTEFGFEDITVVFSGGRGYHVHIRDEEVQNLGRAERSEIVNYVYGRGFDLDDETNTSQITTAESVYRTRGGWYARVYDEVCDRIDTLKRDIEAGETETAIERLTVYDGIGEKTAKSALQELEANEGRIKAGELHIGKNSDGQRVLEKIANDVITSKRAEVDEPVTTDINRLIRLPGTLHGGSGLKVTEISPEEIDDFKPLTDAIPDKFKEFDIKIKVTESRLVELNGNEEMYEPGEYTVPEYVAIYLMAQGVAEKVPET